MGKKKGSKYSNVIFQKKSAAGMHHGCVLVTGGKRAGDCRFNPSAGQGNRRQSSICKAGSTLPPSPSPEPTPAPPAPTTATGDIIVAGKSCSEAGQESLSEEDCKAY